MAEGFTVVEAAPAAERAPRQMGGGPAASGRLAWTGADGVEHDVELYHLVEGEDREPKPERTPEDRKPEFEQGIPGLYDVLVPGAAGMTARPAHVPDGTTPRRGRKA